MEHKEEKRKRKPMKYKRLFVTASIFLLMSTLIFLLRLFKVDVLGLKYMAFLILFLILIELFLLFVLNKRFKVIIKVPFLIVSLIFSFVLLYGAYNLNITAAFVEKVVSEAVKEEKYNIYVLSTSKYEKVEDIDKTRLGYFDNSSETLESALTSLKKKTTFKVEKVYQELDTLFNDLKNKKLDVIYISSTLIESIKEQYGELLENFRLIGEITVSMVEEVEKSNIDVTKDPFLIYVSGLDTYGSIGTVSRSDVNILIAVNPKTHKILLINTPRDYYVKLHSKKAMDKLTHAGIYGVEESMNTLEDLYVTDVDFYLKINFSSLIKIVDAIGGINVNSKYNFSYDGFTFKKGLNNLNGKATLAFSRCRKELPNGDASRGENQEAVIKAIIEKISNPGIISKYSAILKTMEKAFITNMSENDIYSLAKFQLNNNPRWIIDSINASGTNGYETTYSLGKTKLYVMIPDEEKVTDVKYKLNEILEED